MRKSVTKEECRFYVGIDYGTSTSKLAYAAPPLRGREEPFVKNFSFTRKGTDSSLRYPSAVAFERRRAGSEQTPHTGFDAESLASDARKVNNGSVRSVGSPKMDLGEGYIYPFLPLEFSEPVDLVTLTLHAMVAEFEKTLRVHRSACRFMITVPASFSSGQREELLVAAKSLGIEVDQHLLIDEPNAAFLGFVDHPQMYQLLRGSAGSHVILVDFGAGTCDISILRIADDPTNEPYGIEIVNLAVNDFAQLGGNDIDRILADRMFDGGAAGESAAEPPDDADGDRISSLLSIHARREKERLLNLGRADARGHQKEDRLAVPKLKSGRISLPARNIPYHPEELRSAIDSVLGRSEGRRVSLQALVWNVLGKARILPKDVGAIVLAGGSAKLFQSTYFRGFITRLFPDLDDSRILSVDDPDLLISRGAAIECYHTFNRGKPLIRPICPGKIGVRTAEGENVELIRAGMPLPYPNQEDAQIRRSLFVPDPVPEVLRVPIVVQRFGAWVPVETWRIPMPKSTEPGTALEFQCSMNSDKVLVLSCHSKVDSTLSFRTETTKWMHGSEPTPCEERIFKLRAILKREAKEHRPLAPGDLVNLVREEFKAKMFALVRRRVESLLGETPGLFTVSEQATLYNLRGLSADQMGDYRVALGAYLKAAALLPAEPVFHYNVGATYLWNFSDPEKAMVSFRAATECTRGHPHAWYWYGELLERKGELDRSRQCYGSASAILRDTFTPSADHLSISTYKNVCNKLNVEYPAVLVQAIAGMDAHDPDTVPPGLIDHGDIIKRSPDQKDHEIETL